MGILLIFIAASYFLGSVSSAIIVCKIFGLPDPRSTGSNNPGATNVLRIAGKTKAAIVLLCDLLKGFLPVLVAQYFLLPNFWIGFVGLCTVIGHVFPIFYNGKGGKGVATALGVYLGVNVWIGLLCILSWLVVFKLFRYSSLASLVVVFLAPFYVFFLLDGNAAWIAVALIGILVIYQHHQNIKRLLSGTESKFNKSS